MKSKHARTLLKAVLKKGDLTIRPTDGDSRYHSETRTIFINLLYNLPATTTAGLEAGPLSIVMGHELGHAGGTKDDGPGDMNNIIENENPIRRDLGLPERTEY